MSRLAHGRLVIVPYGLEHMQCKHKNALVTWLVYRNGCILTLQTCLAAGGVAVGRPANYLGAESVHEN